MRRNELAVFVCRLILLMVASCSVSAQALVTTKEHILAFTKVSETSNLTLNVIVSNWGTQHSAYVRVTVPANRDFQRIVTDIYSGTSKTIPLAIGDPAMSSLVMEDQGVYPSVVSVLTIALEEQKIAVQAFITSIKTGARNEASYLTLPVSSLTNKYAVLTSCDSGYCVIAVLARHNHTYVSVTLSLPTNMSLKYNGKDYRDGETVMETLQEYEALQLLIWACDMSGTLVTSNNPVAVLSGSALYHSVVSTSTGSQIATTSPPPCGIVCKLLTSANGGGSSLQPNQTVNITDSETALTQVPPLELSGTKYIMAPSPSAPVPVKVKVLAVLKGTRISFRGSDLTAVTNRFVWTFFLQEGQLEVLTANGPVLVAQFHAGHNNTHRATGDAAMFFLVPVYLWRPTYLLWLPENPGISNHSTEGRGAILVLLYPNETQALNCLSAWNPQGQTLSLPISNASHRYVASSGSTAGTVAGVWVRVQKGGLLSVNWECAGNGTIWGYVYGFGGSMAWALALGFSSNSSSSFSNVPTTPFSNSTHSGSSRSTSTSTLVSPVTSALMTSSSTTNSTSSTLSSSVTSALMTINVTTPLPTSQPTHHVNNTASNVSSPTTFVPTMAASQASLVHSNVTTLPSTTTTSSKTTTAPFLSNPKLHYCPCPCGLANHTKALNASLILLQLERHKQELLLPRGNLSSTRRKKISARDDRTSSSVLGVYMTAIPLAVLMGLTYFDFCHQGIVRVREVYARQKPGRVSAERNGL